MKEYDIPEREIIYENKKTKSKYRPDFCGLLIEHMGDGYSFESFAGKVGVSRSTLYNWRDRIPEFLAAHEVAVERALLFWEEKLIEGATGEVKANANLMIFKLKNSFGDMYKDKTEVEHKNAVPTQIVFNTGIVREGDVALVEDRSAKASLEDTRKRPVIEDAPFTEIIDNGEDLL